MRTPTAILTTLFAIGCAPIGGPHRGPGGDGPDAGTAEACTDPVTKTMDVTLSAADTAPSGLPTSGCWKLQGKLTVSGAANSLAKLGDLREVTDLVIDGAPIERIDSMNPVNVTHSILIQNTTALAGLSNITVPSDATCLSYVQSVSVVNNAALTSLGGIANLHCVSGAVTIQNNAKLTSAMLDSVIRLEGGLLIQDNTVLTEISLQKLQSITSDLVIRHNTALTTIDAMPAIQYLHGSVVIDNNAALTTLPTAMTDPMPYVEGNLTITSNPKLTNIGQFSHFRGANLAINVSNNTALDYCTQARAVGCCVPHNGTAEIHNNKNTGNCSVNSWCHDDPTVWNAMGGNCYSWTTN
jgi:hypothetical protein